MNSRQAGRQVMPAQSHIARALDELLTERQNLAARLVKIDSLIAGMREAFHLPDPRAKTNGVKPSARANGNGNGHRGDLTDEAITSALKAGPMNPGALASALGVERTRLRARLAELEERGVVESSGVTAGRRIALASAKRSPAKEAP